MPSERFITLPTIDGYDVIGENSGRPYAHRDTAQSANGVAFVLNQAAEDGPRAMARALVNVRTMPECEDLF